MQKITVNLNASSVIGRLLDDRLQPLGTRPAITREMTATMLIRLFGSDGLPITLTDFASFQLAIDCDWRDETLPLVISRDVSVITASWTNPATGEVMEDAKFLEAVLNVQTTDQMIAAFNGKRKIECVATLAGFFPDNSKAEMVVQFDITLTNRNDLTDQDDPPPNIVEEMYYSKAQIDAIIAGIKGIDAPSMEEIEDAFYTKSQVDAIIAGLIEDGAAAGVIQRVSVQPVGNTVSLLKSVTRYAIELEAGATQLIIDEAALEISDPASYHEVGISFEVELIPQDNVLSFYVATVNSGGVADVSFLSAPPVLQADRTYLLSFRKYYSPGLGMADYKCNIAAVW